MVLVQPVAIRIYHEAWQPMEAGQIGAPQAWENGTKPLKEYLGRFVREKDVQLFLDITHAQRPRTSADLELTVLAPAYILSEMRAGFQIGAVLFLPFLLIDIIVASVTLSIGMVQLPPVMVSAPFKLLLFVLVDGWNLTIGSLMKGFYV
jgi:flagellar biosynthetic protein FliP